MGNVRAGVKCEGLRLLHGFGVLGLDEGKAGWSWRSGEIGIVGAATMEHGAKADVAEVSDIGLASRAGCSLDAFQREESTEDSTG